MAILKVCLEASQAALVVKNPPANEGDTRNTGLIPGLGRSPGGGHGNPRQSSCLEKSTDRGAWGRRESDTTKGLSTEQHNTHVLQIFAALRRE